MLLNFCLLFTYALYCSSFTIPNSMFKKDFEMARLICLFNEIRTLNRIPTLPLGIHDSLNKVAKENVEFSSNQTDKDPLKFDYLQSLSKNNFNWDSAGRILLPFFNTTEHTLTSLLVNPGAKNILMDPTFTHLGSNYNQHTKDISFVFAKGPYAQTLPNCSNYAKKAHVKQIISQETQKDPNFSSKNTTKILFSTTPNNATYISFNSIKKEATFQPILVNVTKQSRRNRIKRKLKNNPIVRWKTSRSGRSFNGAFDYDSIDKKYYKFDLIESICLINFARKQSIPSSPPVGANLVLMEVARNHTEWMAFNNKLINQGEHDATVGERIIEGGMEWKKYGQNIARGINSVDKLIIELLASKGHRERLLSRGFGSVGIWYVPKGNYWTLLMAKGSRNDAPPRNCGKYKMDFLIEHI